MFYVIQLLKLKEIYMYQPFPTRVSVPTGKSSAPLVTSFRESMVKQNHQLLQAQLSKMKQSHEKIKTILNQINNNKAGCQQTINNLGNEIRDLDSKIQNHQRFVSGPSAEEQYKSNIKNLNSEYIEICKERIKVAQSLDLKKLKKIDIEDKKSPANQLFKWAMVSIYNEPDNKYFWPNFREEALDNDKGRDFVERLGKVPAMNLKQQQKLKTQQFLSQYPQIAAAPELVKHQEEANKIKQIAQLFRKGYIVSNSIKENEKLINMSRQATLEKDEQFIRWKARSQALKDRVKLNQDYLSMLNNIEQKLVPKSSLYEGKVDGGSKLLNEFQSLEKWSPTINMGQEPKGNCECSSCSVF